jgi:hypothetical protein
MAEISEKVLPRFFQDSIPAEFVELSRREKWTQTPENN